MDKKIVIASVLLLLLVQGNSKSLIEILGFGHLLEGMAKMTPVRDYLGEKSIIYSLDPNIHTFLRMFNSRTEFCDYKCQSFFNLPCFFLFSCNIQIRNLILLFFFPIFIIILTGVCCGKGIWTIPCWLKYLAIFTGITFLIWAVKKCAGSGKIRERK